MEPSNRPVQIADCDELARSALAGASDLALNTEEARSVTTARVLCAAALRHPEIRSCLEAAGTSPRRLLACLGPATGGVDSVVEFAPREARGGRRGPTNLIVLLRRLLAVDPALREALRRAGAGPEDLDAALSDLEPDAGAAIVAHGPARSRLIRP